METDDPDVVICRCFHLTNFAVLVVSGVKFPFPLNKASFYYINVASKGQLLATIMLDVKEVCACIR